MNQRHAVSQTHEHHQGHELPTARWVVGHDAFGRQAYVVHTAEPAFIAKLSSDSDEGVLSGLSFAMQDGRSLYDFLWHDSPPDGRAFDELLRQCELAVLREKVPT